MIVWLASFPRSGNTFLRIVLNRLYGVTSSVVYDFDGVADRVGGALVGYEDRPASYQAMREAETAYFIKTHRQRDHVVHENDRAICIARDGRDSLVSWARQRSKGDSAKYDAELRALIDLDTPTGTGSWGANVLSWFRAPLTHSVRIRYDALIADPKTVAAHLIGAVAPHLRLRENADIPSFSELHTADPLFFRRGVTGTHRDEFPEELQNAFWARRDNQDAMALLGYG